MIHFNLPLNLIPIKEVSLRFSSKNELLVVVFIV